MVQRREAMGDDMTISDCRAVTPRIEVNSLNGDLISYMTNVSLELISLLNPEFDLSNIWEGVEGQDGVAD
jgi:hypothetical protein